MFLLSFIGLHIVTQVLLLVLFFTFRPLITAAHELYLFSPALAGFYLLSCYTVCSFIWALLRRYVFLSEVGAKAERASWSRRRELRRG